MTLTWEPDGAAKVSEHMFPYMFKDMTANFITTAGGLAPSDGGGTTVNFADGTAHVYGWRCVVTSESEDVGDGVTRYCYLVNTITSDDAAFTIEAYSSEQADLSNKIYLCEVTTSGGSITNLVDKRTAFYPVTEDQMEDIKWSQLDDDIRGDSSNLIEICIGLDAAYDPDGFTHGKDNTIINTSYEGATIDDETGAYEIWFSVPPIPVMPNSKYFILKEVEVWYYTSVNGAYIDTTKMSRWDSTGGEAVEINNTTDRGNGSSGYATYSITGLTINLTAMKRDFIFECQAGGTEQQCFIRNIILKGYYTE